MEDERPLKKKNNNNKKKEIKKKNDKRKDKSEQVRDKSSKRKHEEKEKKKKAKQQPKKSKKEGKEDREPVKLQDEVSVLLNTLVTKLPEDKEATQLSTAVISRTETTDTVSSSSEEESIEDNKRQMVPYQQQSMVNATEPVIDMNSTNASKLLDCVKTLIADNASQRDEMVKYAMKKATNKALIEVARLNGDHKASKLEGRLEFALEEIKKKDDELARKEKRIATLEAELKKKEEVRNQRVAISSPSHHSSGQIDNSDTTNSSNNNNYNKDGDDSLTASNIPYLAHAVGDGKQLDKSIAMLVHCRAEIAELNFGSNVNTIIVPVSGIYNFAQLMPFLTGHTLTRDTPVYNAIAQVGIYLKSNCYPIVPIQQPGCNDLNGYAYDETNTEASRYNLAVITQTICTQELINHLFNVVCIGEPSTADDSDEDEETNEMCKPVSRTKKSVKKSVKQQAKEEKKITRLYDPAFQTHPKMTAIMSHIPHVDELPLVSPHFTSFMAVPVKPDYIGKSKSQGGWKECSMCGSHCTFSQKTHLSNHINKQCPFYLVSCASFQAELVAREKFNDKFTVNTPGILSKFTKQMNVCDEEYKKIRSLISTKYTKFFTMTNTQAPTSFSATLINCHAEPYNKSDLGRALNNIINAGKSTFDYSRHAEEYRMAHNDDVRMAMNVTDQYKHTNYRREQMIAEIFRKSLVVAVPLQTRGTISICRRAVDDLLLKRESETPMMNTTATTTTQQPTNGSSFMEREMDKCSAYSSVVSADTELCTLKNQYNSLQSHRDNEIRLDRDVNELNHQLEEMRNQIVAKEQEVALQQTNYDNYITQSNQVSFNATQWSQQQQQQQPMASNVFQMNIMPQQPLDFATFLRTLSLPPVDPQENNNNNTMVIDLPQLSVIENNNNNNNNNNDHFVVVPQEVPVHNEQPAAPLYTPFVFPDTSISFHTIPEQMLGESDEEYKARTMFC